MKGKQSFSLLSAGCLLTAALILPASAQESHFPDVTDPAQIRAVELLRALDIVSGTETGLFQPERSLSRAEFCKMTVELTGNGSKAASQLNRTIFKDVPSTHWARGYIHVAATAEGETPAMIRGDATGLFHPDQSISCAEAITILSRVLGYSDSDVSTGVQWYSGYWTLAQQEELLDGLTLNPTDDLTRGQAALLFENLLFAEAKGSTSPYLTTLGCTIEENAILLNTEATTTDGTGRAVKTDTATYTTELTGLSADLKGTRSDLVLNKDKELIALLPEEHHTVRRVTLASSEASYLVLDDGSRIEVDREADVWQNGEKTSYDKLWASLKSGTSFLLAYDATGELDYLFLTSVPAKDTQVQVLKRAEEGFSFPDSAPLYKNGVRVSADDLRQYDVGVYDESGAVQISDRRLTGIYENASPNTTTPETIRLMGCDFPVLDSALDDLQLFQIGDRMTLLLTLDNEVAGVVTPEAASSNAVGIAEITKGSTKVTLFDGEVTVSGKNNLSDNSARTLDGKLVTVSASKQGYLSAVPVKSSSGLATIDLAAGTMGKYELAANVRFYDCVNGGVLTEVQKEDFVSTTIPRSKLLYAAFDYAGRVSYVVLDDVTGDCYDYGYVLCSTTHSSGDRVYDLVLENNETSITVSDLSLPFQSHYGGVVLNQRGTLAARVELVEMKASPRSAFDVENMTLTSSDGLWVIADQVQCYNKTTDEWYTPGAEGLEKALSFARKLTPYHDHTDHAKIRVIVFE